MIWLKHREHSVKGGDVQPSSLKISGRRFSCVRVCTNMNSNADWNFYEEYRNWCFRWTEEKPRLVVELQTFRGVSGRLPHGLTRHGLSLGTLTSNQNRSITSDFWKQGNERWKRGKIGLILHTNTKIFLILGTCQYKCQATSQPQPYLGNKDRKKRRLLE